MKKAVFYIGICTLFLAGCSSQSNTVTSKAFHNTTAHFNGYWYAKEEVTKIEKDNLKAHIDDYNEILLLYPPLDSTRAKGYDKEIQEAIKMASLAIQRHPNSKWVDDSYIMVGKARLLSLDWGNAIQTFKYVNTKSKNPDARHEAIIQLARTFTEHDEFNNAVAAFDFLEKEELNKTNQKNFYLQRAHYFQKRKNYDYMVRNLTKAIPLLKKGDRRGRIYFIIGQVYQELGLEAEAFNFYKKTISTNPEYEIDFYARLYMAQVAEISRSRDLASARKSFRKLLKDSKNKDFRDKIYYEMGVFEFKQHNLKEAMANYNLAVREGSNKLIDGEAYLRLGEIYYDTIKNFQLSQAYYDSAVSSLPTTHENYKAIQARQKILNEFVKNLNTIAWQDSLLVMAKMDTASLRKHIAAVLESQKKPEIKTKKPKKARVAISEVSTTVNNEGSFDLPDWYFGNPTAVALGQTEFTRIWGGIPLADNWRRSSRASTGAVRSQNNQTASTQTTQTTATENVAAKDPVKVEFDRILGELPLTDSTVAIANGKIEDAYFNLGNIYYFDLKETDNAIKSYETLLTRFPKTEYRAETLYKLYLILKDTDSAKANQLADDLKKNYPESSYAKILINPNYLQESGLVVEQQKLIYKKAYEHYEVGDLGSAAILIQEGLTMASNSEFTPNLKLLSILLVGKTENISQYQLRLEDFVKEYSGSDLAKYAQRLLDSSRAYTLQREKEKGIQYIPSLQEPHFFVLISEKKDAIEGAAARELERFNSVNFNDRKLKVSNLILNDTYTLTLVSDLSGLQPAREYLKTFNEKRESLSGLKNYKFSYFVITKDNFDIFYRTKGIDEYTRFFEKNYNSQNP
ncbi:MAG TPA: tetratricopeptide repeat protein [Cyclobacteriaceae bacterium]|nr:tetratricopeptide repeat protein [Cyclobacteriaceae bacterium]HMV07640.1 tetratricopeptide repeat protein [Cyclobacteriaceae bacterium]HMV89369.1 tetratricopeptide repeat protein [Cyclobacteriaceae bacterium]HMW98775.1 tetratricopeptide repeat protein [Cyclobacteriaceae bacterium]HMX48592.1 tetratricopeptide repeat protein [Cyclobacteriaceae bacterium]